jgi:predicted DNA-binding antitoxin AbrB/MazE fold protein
VQQGNSKTVFENCFKLTKKDFDEGQRRKIIIGRIKKKVVEFVWLKLIIKQIAKSKSSYINNHIDESLSIERIKLKLLPSLKQLALKPYLAFTNTLVFKPWLHWTKFLPILIFIK